MFITSCLRETRFDKFNSLIPSQHNVGQACDIQFNDTGGNVFAKIIDRVNWMRDNLPFDQLLLETMSKQSSFWIHLSFTGVGISRSVAGNSAKGNRDFSDRAKFGTLMDHQWAGYSTFVDPHKK
jgi:hypothetical protein